VDKKILIILSAILTFFRKLDREERKWLLERLQADHKKLEVESQGDYEAREGVKK